MTTTEQYFRCPYCSNGIEGGHTVRVPRSIGKYRVKTIYKNTLIFECHKCARITRIPFDSVILWDRLDKTKKEDFNKQQYQKYLQSEKGGIKK